MCRQLYLSLTYKAKEPLINAMSAGQTKQKSTKKLSLRVVNEHFEAIFNAVWTSEIVNQRFSNNSKHSDAARQRRCLSRISALPQRPLLAGFCPYLHSVSWAGRRDAGSQWSTTASSYSFSTVILTSPRSILPM